MSEPSSMVARVRLSESALAAFKESVPALPSQFQDWQPWLANRTYYGNITDAEIQSMTQDNIATVEKMLEVWLGAPQMNNGREQYDAATQTWTFGILQCSENYYDFIEALSWLREIARYKDLPGEDSILIFPYLWGGSPEAYLVITSGGSHFSDEIPEEVMEQASAEMAEILDELERKFSTEDL